jgi:hypothetical protein
MSFPLRQFTHETNQRLLQEAQEQKTLYLLSVVSPYQERQKEYLSQLIGFSYDVTKVHVTILPLPRPGLNCQFEVTSTIKLTPVVGLCEFADLD